MSLHSLALRLNPGDDLRGAVEAALRATGQRAGFVLQGIGSLSVANLRYAGLPEPTELRGDLEILSLAGSVAPDGAHLHMSVSDSQGRVLGGHVGVGCIVRTTAELLLALLSEQQFSREFDSATGFKELAVRPVSASKPAERG
jgi:predicted DNA-binding protein with PD1-like motif